jgi:predicted amidophosphoribosyltransferase
VQRHILQHKRVVLIDEVMTSGASMEVAAIALSQSGAAHNTDRCLLAPNPE